MIRAQSKMNNFDNILIHRIIQIFNILTILYFSSINNILLFACVTHMYYINQALDLVSLTKFLHMLKSECSIYFGLDIICVVIWQWDNRKKGC